MLCPSQGCTDPGCGVARATKYCMVALTIFGLSIVVILLNTKTYISSHTPSNKVPVTGLQATLELWVLCMK